MTLVDQAAADETHPHIAAYSRAMYRVSPLAGSAGLHVIAPVAILLTLALIAVGAVRPLTREKEPAVALLATASQRAAFEKFERQLVTIVHGRRSLTPVEAQRAQIAANGMLAVARGSGLRGCERVGNNIKCDGLSFSDAWVPACFAFGILGAWMALVLWIGALQGGAWLRPYWSPRLWYTPVYAVAVVMLTCGPFLMATLFLHRADADYRRLPVDRSAFAVPSVLFYALVVLQLTALIVSLVQARARLMPALRWVAGPVAGVFAASIASAWISGWYSLALTVALVTVSSVLGPLLLARLVVPRGREHGRLRILELSLVLAVAWVLFAADRILGAHGVVHELLVGACIAVCVVHFFASYWLELGPISLRR